MAISQWSEDWSNSIEPVKMVKKASNLGLKISGDILKEEDKPRIAPNIEEVSVNNPDTFENADSMLFIGSGFVEIKIKPGLLILEVRQAKNLFQLVVTSTSVYVM
jgi:hypothetical protein